MPSNTVNYSGHLTNLGVSYLGRPRGLAHNVLFPKFGVPLDVGNFKIFDAARAAMRLKNLKVGPKSAAETLDVEWTSSAYQASNYALSTSRTPGELNPLRDPNAKQNGVNSLIANLETNIEYDAKVAFQAATSAASAPSPTFDNSSSEPIAYFETQKTVIRNAMRGTPGEYDIVLGLHVDVISKLVDHPDIAGRILGGSTSANPGVVTLNNLAIILGVDRLVPLEAAYNAGDPNESASLTNIWNKGGFIIAQSRTVGPMINTFGLGLTPDKVADGSVTRMIDGVSVSDWWTPGDPRLWKVRADIYVAHKVINTSAGLELTGLIA